jgi:FAD:protein FMN transferase
MPILHQFTHRAMACDWELFIIGQEAEYAQQVAWAAFDEVDRIEGELSRFIASSDVFQINAAGPGQWTRVGLATLECLELALGVHEATGGAFDVTLGAVLESRRGDDGLIEAPPDEASVARPALPEIVAIAREAHAVTLLHEGAAIDLGAVGKGYGLDQMARVLRDWSVASALLHSGGSSVLALGAPPDEAAWTVALRDPRTEEATPWRVALRDRALSGSAMRLHGAHILDPHTGAPAQGKLAAWAIAPSAALSDALSTAFMVMPADAVEELCAYNPPIAGLLMTGHLEAPQWRRCGAFEGLEEAGPEL